MANGWVGRVADAFRIGADGGAAQRTILDGAREGLDSLQRQVVTVDVVSHVDRRLVHHVQVNFDTFTVVERVHVD